MQLCYANPPLPKLSKVLTKMDLEGARVVLFVTDWGTPGEHPYWCRLLDRLTVGSTELPDSPIYVRQNSQETIPAPEWGSFLSIVDDSLNHLPVSDLDQVVLRDLMAQTESLPSGILRKNLSTVRSPLRVVRIICCALLANNST